MRTKAEAAISGGGGARTTKAKLTKSSFLGFFSFIWFFLLLNVYQAYSDDQHECDLHRLMIGHETSELSSCSSNSDCHGDGRRCMQNRCEGFAGNAYVSRDCVVGKECALSLVRGHYDDTGVYKLIVVDGPPSMCGAKNVYKISNNIQSLKPNESKQENSNSIAFNFGSIYTCQKNSVDACTAKLGEITAGAAVGNFAVCGCSNVHSEEGVCSSPESFNVPLGLLNIHGFGRPHINASAFSSSFSSSYSSASCGIPQSSSPSFSFASSFSSSSSDPHASSYTLNESALEQKKRSVGDDHFNVSSSSLPSLLGGSPQFVHAICKTGSLCVIPDFLGYEISTDTHFIRAVYLPSPSLNSTISSSVSATDTCDISRVVNVTLRAEEDGDDKKQSQASEQQNRPLGWRCKTDSARRKCIISLSDEEVLAVSKIGTVGLCGCSSLDVKTQRNSSAGVNLPNHFLYSTKCEAGLLLGVLEVPNENNNNITTTNNNTYVNTNVNYTNYNNRTAEEENQRRLQSSTNEGYITDDAANVPADKNGKQNPNKSVKRKECEKHSDCLSGMGQCVEGECTGFIPDLNDERLFRCVEGYHCTLKPGDIPGKRITNKYMVIAISPAEACGTAPNLQKLESLFANSNKWACDEGNAESCIFRAGVGFRRNKTHTVEGVRLCGCPNGDMNGDNVPCNHVRDFYVPVGRLGVQECMTNAHCIDKRFAYCVFDHCGGFLVSAASAGLKAYECIRNQDCTLEKIAAKSVNEALKVLPVAANFTCGGESALDPDSIKADALPCLIDMNNDGNCDINLGVTKALGTSRLCGCSGQDLGGSGKACDQLEDFDADLGMLSIGECVINQDCPAGRICAKGECLLDTLPPYVVQVRPANDSVVVPPIKTIDLVWNENIEWGASGKRIVLQSMSDPSVAWEIKLPDQTAGKKKLYPPRNVQPQFELALSGQTLKVTPDTSLYTFPEGVYRLGYEYGFVNDLQKNPNDGSTNIQFAISKDAGCPYLYLTGFSTENGNPNWLYEPVEPVSGKAAWKGGERKNLFIYWKKPVNDQPGNWVLDTNLDPSNFLAFPELELMDKLPEKEKARPPSGTWMKWSGTGRIAQEDVIVHCTTTPDRTLPTLLAIEPKIGEVGWPIDGVIKMTFSKKMNYGHWATISISGRDTGHTVTLVPDWEAHMRGEGKPIQIKDGKQGSIVELHLPEPLKLGETYDIVVEMGALTDLAYNPWGPVEAGTLVFTTYGSSCPELNNLGIAYILNSTDHSHQSVVSIGCTNGYTSKVGGGGNITLTCTDGVWSDFQIDCKADCGKHPLMGMSQYKIEGDVSNTQHGAKIRISCAADAVQLEGSARVETVVCREGKWDKSSLICGGTCGSFPSLGPNYAITGSEGIIVGTKRIVKCTPPARPADKSLASQEIMCVDGGWQNVTIQCHVDCSADFQGLGPAYIVKGEGKTHGSMRTLSCAEGYISTTEEDEGTAKCEEGKWINDGKVDCRISCPELNLGAGYSIKALPGHRKNSHMSQIELSCNPHDLRESGPASETLTCTNGAWSLHTISCRASCGSPLDQFGDRYEISNLPSSPPTYYKHGSSLKVTCVSGASPSKGSDPQTIVCDDGRWRSENKKRAKIDNANKPDKDADSGIYIDLVCKASCPFPKLEIIHKINPSMKGRRRTSYRDSTALQLTCSNGYSASDISQSSATITCSDGSWEPKPTFMCRKDCEAQELVSYGQNMDYYVTPLGGLYTHGSTRQVTCQSGSERITGPTEDKIVCKNGHFSLPRLICGAPTCDDGLKNGDEVGIDCEGSCPEQCGNTCTDGVRNGDEEDVDCGGSVCPSCTPCTFPPEISNSYALSDSSGNIYVDVKDITETVDVPPGTPVHVQCAEDFYPARIDTIGRFNVLYCRGGEWNVQDLRMECLAPTCTDGIRNGDEFGVDCGGSCPNVCPTCYDGIKNGDEEYVDCGGSCDACASCSLAAIKPFLLSPDLYTILKQKSSVQDISAANVQQPNTAHGVLARIACARDTSVFADVVCLNGAWTAHDAEKNDETKEVANQDESKEQLNGLVNVLSKLMQDCEGGTGAEQRWDNQDLLQFHAPRFLDNYPSKESDEEETEQTGCVYKLLHEFMNELEGECGALVYGGSLSKVGGFCEGSCLDKLGKMLQTGTEKCNSLIQKESDNEILAREKSVARVPQLLEELLEVFCEQRQNQQTKKKEYCFANAKETLNAVSNLNTLADGRINLQTICPASSCFRSNFQYLLILSSLSEQVEDLESKVMYGSDDDGGDGDNNDAEPTDSRLLHESMEPHLFSRKPWNRRLHEAAELVGSFEPFAASMITSLMPNLGVPKPRVLQEGKPNGNGKVAISAGTAQYLKTLSNINTILDLMCLDVEGTSCAPFVLAVGRYNPVLGMRHPSSSEVTDVHPCESKCYLEVTRRMGQALKNSNMKKKSPHPYDTALSSLMVSYGRLYCQQSYSETYCGELIFPDSSSYLSSSGVSSSGALSNSFIAASSAAYEKLWYFEYTPATPKDFPSCGCPVEFIGDGDCDLSCFVQECGWDHADCLASTMFPEVYLKATADFPLYNNCNPFRDDFSCADSSQDTSCISVVQSSIEKNGCCTAALFEVLRDLLEIDSEHPLIQSGQMSLMDVPLLSSVLSTASQSTSSSSAIETDRSVAWIEQACQVSLDRTCSRGLQRAALSIDLKVDNLMYSKLFGKADTDSGANGKEFMRIVRRTVADLLAIPVADVTQMLTWPGSVDVKMIIDAGWIANMKSFNQDVQNLIDSGILAKALSLRIGGDEVLLGNSTISVQNSGPITDELRLVPSGDIGFSPQSKFGAFKENTNSTIQVAQDSVKAETLEVKVPPVSPSGAPPLPQYGTFGMGRMAATLPRPSCSDDLQLDLPEGTPFYDMYETRLSGTAHGARREVACASQYDAIKGVSPQELVCDQGRWVPPVGEQKIVCRLPCQPYEKVDEVPLGPEYIMSGVGERSGDTRTIYCARGFIPSSGPASGSETLTCDNGQWTPRNVTCVADPDGNSVGTSSTQKSIGGKCSDQLQALGEPYSVSEIGYSASDVPKSLATVMQVRFPPSSRSLQLLAINCARGFASINGKSSETENDSNEDGIKGIGSYYLTCIDGNLYGLGTEHPFGASWVSKKSGNMEEDEAAQKVAQLEDRIQNSSIIDLKLPDNAVVHLMGCKEDIRSAPSPTPKPLNDTLMITMILIGILLLFIILVTIIYIFKRRKQKKAMALKLKLQQEAAEAAFKEKKSDATDAGTSVASETDTADARELRLHRNEHRNIGAGVSSVNGASESYYDGTYTESEIDGRSYVVPPHDYSAHYNVGGTMVLAKPPQLAHSRGFGKAKYLRGPPRGGYDSSVVSESYLDESDGNETYSAAAGGAIAPSEVTDSANSMAYSDAMVEVRRRHNPRNFGAGALGPDSLVNWTVDEGIEESEAPGNTPSEIESHYETGMHHKRTGHSIKDGESKLTMEEEDEDGRSILMSGGDVCYSRSAEFRRKGARIPALVTIEDNSEIYYDNEEIMDHTDTKDESGAEEENEVSPGDLRTREARQASVHKLQSVVHTDDYCEALAENDENVDINGARQPSNSYKEEHVSQSLSKQQLSRRSGSNHSPTNIAIGSTVSSTSLSSHEMEAARVTLKRQASSSSRSYKANASNGNGTNGNGNREKPLEKEVQISPVVPTENLPSNWAKYMKSHSENRGRRTTRAIQQRSRSSSRPRPVPVLHETSAYYEEPEGNEEGFDTSNYLMAYGDDRRFMNEDDELYPEDSASCVAATIHARTMAQQQLKLMQQLNSRSVALQQGRNYPQGQQPQNSRIYSQQQLLPPPGGRRNLAQQSHFESSSQFRTSQRQPGTVGGSGRMHSNERTSEKHGR